MLALDIHPHIHLGEVRERKDAEMLAGVVSPVEEIPEFGALVFGIPLAELITVRKEALLGAGLFLITAAATEAGVEFVLLDGVEKGNGLKLVAGGVGPLLLLHAALVDRVLDEADHEPGSEFFGKGIAVVERLLEIMSGVHMQEQERNFRRPERLRREVGHDDGILATREKQGGVLELGRRLTQDVNGFGFEVVEMVELVVRHFGKSGLRRKQSDRVIWRRKVSPPRWDGDVPTKAEHIPPRKPPRCQESGTHCRVPRIHCPCR